MYILGISAFYHDSAACLIRDGEIIGAAQEERFTREKGDASFPVNAINFCLAEAGLDLTAVDHIVFYEKPFQKFERLLETYIAYAPKGFRSFATSMPLWVKDKIFQKRAISAELNEIAGEKTDWNDKLLFSEHHLSHAASAYYPSPFESAAVLTLDGVGEWATTSLAIGHNEKLEIHREIHFPHSVGFLYSAFTYYTGFKVNSGEYKVMGLAPYGEPKFADRIRDNLIDVHEDGSFQLNMDYFGFCTELKMTNDRFHSLFEGEPRKPETHLTQREMDLAASVQKVTEDIVLKLAKNIRMETGETNLCLAGGVALNCVANGLIERSEIFDQIWIQPAAGDAGGALGAALAAYHLSLGNPRSVRSDQMDGMKGGYLGPAYSRDEIVAELNELGAVLEECSDGEIVTKTAQALANGKAVGWMQDRMEFGPRALGARSILADPRSPEMQKNLNLKVKFRESFRPFAPSVLAEHSQDWFECKSVAPYMQIVANVKSEKRFSMSDEQESLFGIDKLNIARSEVPAITHVDYSARLQTVHRETNPRYHELISEFYRLTGCPMLVNTSFNIRGEPIVCTPKDAFRCFMGTDLDVLVISNVWLEKPKQNLSLDADYRDSYELD
ncbi:MAG: carbamoyltransferase [Pseudomonadota bacterium]